MNDFTTNELYLLLAAIFVLLALVLYNRSRKRRSREQEERRSLGEEFGAKTGKKKRVFKR